MQMFSVIAVLLAASYTDNSVMSSTPFYTGAESRFTDKIEDRVNLWPLAYYREPSLSVLWPIYSQADDHLAIRPLYSQYRQGGKNASFDEFNFIFSFCQFDTRNDEYRIFPVFWGKKYLDLFPLIWWRYGRSFTLLPLMSWEKDRSFSVFPFWWSNEERRLLIPFYYQDENSLQIIPFYGSKRLIDGYTKWIGPYGWHRSDREWENYDWCFPFYYKDATSLETMLFGWDRNNHSSWAFPFYYSNYSRFVSTLWISWQDQKKEEKGWLVPPLLSWGRDSARGKAKLRFLLGLVGFDSSTDTDVSCSWAFPVYYMDNDEFLSLPYGQSKSFHYVTPFVGITHEENRKGAWLWPLGGWTGDDRMERSETLMSAVRLDSKIGVERRVSTSRGRTNTWYKVTGTSPAQAEFWWLGGLGTDSHWITWGATEKTVTAKSSSVAGTALLGYRNRRRMVEFNLETREKCRDEETDEMGFVSDFIWHSKRETVNGWRKHEEKSLLWRLWHLENREGNVSVDSFPFFTYDSKVNGYSKTSLCGRLFRNEYDPKTDKRSVDLLFIPVWR